MARSLQELAQEAYNVQNACNLSGVVHDFHQAISELRKALAAEGVECSTDAINHHPICVLWADKIASLTGTQVFDRSIVVATAYEVVNRMRAV